MKKVPLFFFLALSISVAAQQITFNKQLKVWTESAANNFQQTADSGYVICTDAVYEMDSLTTNPRSYCYLIKTDKYGDVTWQKSFPKSDYAIKGTDGNSVFQTSDLGYIVATVFYDSTGFTKILVIKTDMNGDLQWSGLYPGIGISTANCVKQCSDSGYIIAGSTLSPASLDRYGYLLKLSNAGAIEWGKKFVDSTHFVDFKTVLEIPGIGFIADGYSLNGGIVVKTDLNGNDLWTKNYLSSSSFFYSIAPADGTNFMCAGILYDPTSTSGIWQRPLLMKIDAGGNILWTKAGDKEGFITDIKRVQGNQLIASASISYTDPSTSIYNSYAALINLDFSGNELWSKGYVSSPLGFSCVDGTFDNAYALYTAAFGGSTWDTWEVSYLKTDSDGNQNCSSIDLPLSFTNVSNSVFDNPPSTLGGIISPTTVILQNSDLRKTVVCQSFPDATLEDNCLFIPNVFSPNNDHTNDLFSISYCGSDLYKIRIYNRWGELQFENNDPTKYWDGDNQAGLPAKDGTYYYLLNLGTKTHKGFITLIR